MANFHYKIIPIAAGWQVQCNGDAGPAYAERDAAVLDTLAIADKWRQAGHHADVRLFDMDGVGQVLTSSDARLFGSH